MSRHAEPFHQLFSVRVGERVLPDLGLAVDTEGLVLDCARGSQWTPEVTADLLELIGELRTIARSLEVVHREDGDVFEDELGWT